MNQMGGLSGPPVLPLALSVVSKFYKETLGKVPIIGCGGIRTGHDALQYAKAGASLVQLYTSLGYEGPGIVVDIKKELAQELEKEQKTWTQMVGSGLQT